MTEPTASAPATNAALIWDLPTRLFHWLLVALVTAMFVTGFTGKLDLHMRLGQATLALVLFRLFWGFIGNAQARFSQFVATPAKALAYARTLLRPDSGRYLGHNPMGGYAVLALLGLVLLQAGSGLFTSDDIATDGPLYNLVSSGTSARLSTIHRLSANALLVVIGLHLAANLFYLLVKKDNLIRPMINGLKPGPAGLYAGGTKPAKGAGNAVALIVFTLCLVLVFGGIRWIS